MRGSVNAWRDANISRRQPVSAAPSQSQNTMITSRRKGGIFVLSEFQAGDNTGQFSRYAKYDSGRGAVGG
jgi:hypothetical protein